MLLKLRLLVQLHATLHARCLHLDVSRGKWLACAEQQLQRGSRGCIQRRIAPLRLVAQAVNRPHSRFSFAQVRHSRLPYTQSTQHQSHVQAPRDSISAAAELVCDAAMRPAITQHKLDEVKAATGKRNGDMVNDPSFMASEGVVAAAYSGALARPVLWTGAPITPETLQDFHAHVRFLGQCCAFRLATAQPCRRVLYVLSLRPSVSHSLCLVAAWPTLAS